MFTINIDSDRLNEKMFGNIVIEYTNGTSTREKCDITYERKISTDEMVDYLFVNLRNTTEFMEFMCYDNTYWKGYLHSFELIKLCDVQFVITCETAMQLCEKQDTYIFRKNKKRRI